MFVRILVLFAGLILTAPAAAKESASLAAARAELAAGVTTSDATRVVAARARFGALAAAEPEALEPRYWIAVACWRATPLLTSTEPERARRMCRDGLAACDAALARTPDDADFVAIRASLQGLWIGFEPAQTMTLGLAMEEAMARASRLAPKNPRVQLLRALHTLHKPEFIGGGATRARDEFGRAIALYEGAADDDDPRAWGRADASLWAGRTAMKLGDPAAAIGHYQRALAAAPAHTWIEKVLLPAAKDSLAARATP